MKKVIVSVALMCSFYSNAQWVNKSVNNDIDEPYHICYTAENNGAVLKLENVEGLISFYIRGTYFCEDYPIVDISFIVDGVAKKYQINGSTSESKTIVWLTDDLMNSKILNDFKACSSVKLRVNDSVCSSEMYSFSMSGSSSAISFINK